MVLTSRLKMERGRNSEIRMLWAGAAMVIPCSFINEDLSRTEDCLYIPLKGKAIVMNPEEVTNVSVSQSKMNIHSVKEFWEHTPCGEHLVSGLQEGSPDYFKRITTERYKWEYHLPSFLDEVAKSGKSVLEIGCGMGIDSSELARRGSDVTGIDLTERGIALARKNFEQQELKGTFKVMNAEALEFPENHFDCVYSFGVLHHTPNTNTAINEVYRVLKKGGKCFIMLYSKYSLNHFVHQVLRAPYEKSLSRPSDDAPVTRVYAQADLEVLFSKFSHHSFRKEYLFGAGWKPVVYCVPQSVNRMLGKALGWHWLIVAEKT